MRLAVHSARFAKQILRRNMLSAVQFFLELCYPADSKAVTQSPCLFRHWSAETAPLLLAVD